MKRFLFLVNVPNSITVAGIILVVLVLMLRGIGSEADWVTFTLTILAILSDFLDGLLARKLKQVTRFGSTLDKFRDKALFLGSAFFIFESVSEKCDLGGLLIPSGYLELTLLVILSLIEVALFFSGIYGVAKGKNVQANIYGKRKMAIECLFLIVWMTENDLQLLSSWTSELISIIILVFACFFGYKSFEVYFSEYFLKAPNQD